MTALLRVFRLAPPRPGRAGAALFYGAGTVLAGTALLAVSGALISKAALQPPVLALGALIAAVRGLALGRAGLRYAERLATHDVALRVAGRLRAVLFARLAPRVAAGDGRRRGDLLSLFVQDADQLQLVLVRGVAPVLSGAVAAIAIVAVAAWALPAAGVVLAAGLLASASLVPAAALAAGRRAARRQADARAHLSAEVLELAVAAPELALAGRGAERVERLVAADGRLAALGARDAVAQALALALGTIVAGATLVGVVAVGAGGVADGRLDGVLLAALAFGTLAAFEATAPLPAAVLSLQSGAAAARRTLAITEAPEPTPAPAQPRALPDDATLRLDDVWLRFGDDGPWILRGATLTIQPGERMALVGASGAGKSTLLGALARFLDPHAGKVTLGGIDVRALDPRALRLAVRLAAQDAHLFTTSIRQNVRLARPDAGDEQIAQALADAGLGPWLATLPDGLDTLVGEDGAQVSGGQRQRIALARALLADARVLLLDEPTAHLDPAGAQRLLADLPRIARGRTVIAVLHQADSFAAFDRVVELRDGRLRPAPGE